MLQFTIFFFTVCIEVILYCLHKMNSVSHTISKERQAMIQESIMRERAWRHPKQSYLFDKYSNDKIYL